MLAHLIGLVALSDAGLFACVLLVSLALGLAGHGCILLGAWGYRQWRMAKALEDWMSESRGPRRW